MSKMFGDIWNCQNEGVTSSWITNGMFKWKVGNGARVKFWKDVWHGNEELKIEFNRLFNLSLDKNISVAEMKDKWSLDEEASGVGS